jgi:hypothetical protein
LDRVLEAEPALIDRARLLLDIVKPPLHGIGATALKILPLKSDLGRSCKSV